MWVKKFDLLCCYRSRPWNGKARREIPETGWKVTYLGLGPALRRLISRMHITKANLWPADIFTSGTAPGVEWPGSSWKTLIWKGLGNNYCLLLLRIIFRIGLPGCQSPIKGQSFRNLGPTVFGQECICQLYIQARSPWLLNSWCVENKNQKNRQLQWFSFSETLGGIMWDCVIWGKRVCG